MLELQNPLVKGQMKRKKKLVFKVSSVLPEPGTEERSEESEDCFIIRNPSESTITLQKEKPTAVVSRRNVRFHHKGEGSNNSPESNVSIKTTETKDKCVIRTKSMVGSSTITRQHSHSGNALKRAGLKKRLQSIYKHFDIITDDQTACDMKDMVARFNNLSKEKELCVHRQCVWAMFGLLVNITQREIDYNTGDTILWLIIVNVLRSFVTISTGLMIYYLHRYHDNQVRFCSLNKIFMAWENLWTTSRNYIPFLWDVAVYFIHEPPFVNIKTNVAIGGSITHPIYVNNVFSLFMFFRCFLIIRHTSSSVYRGGTQILGIWHNFTFGLGFTMRNMLYTHPLRTLIPTFTSLTAIAWYWLNTCERYAEGGKMQSGLDSLWVLCVTMTTVGYGDAYPSTECGRWTLVASAITSQCLLAVVISTLHQKLSLMPFESRMVEFLAHAQSVKKLRTYAANVIKDGWLLSKARKKAGLAGRRRTFRGPALKKFTDSVFLFERHRNTVQAYDRRYRNDQLIRSMLEDISVKCEESKMYYAAANQIAARTGRALSHKKNRIYRQDGSLKPCSEQEFEVIDERNNELRGVVNNDNKNNNTNNQEFKQILNAIKQLQKLTNKNTQTISSISESISRQK